MSTQEDVNQLGHIVVHLHGCCLYPYRHEGLTNVLLNGEYSGQDEHGRWVLLLLHPRWCPECINQRSQAIATRYEERLLQLQKANANVEDVWIELAYVEGVRDGRIKALSISFADLPGWNKSRVVEGESVNDVAEELADMVVGSRRAADAENADDLAAIMAKEGLGGDDFDEEFELCWKEYEAREKGLEEGIGEQSQNEVSRTDSIVRSVPGNTQEEGINPYHVVEEFDERGHGDENALAGDGVIVICEKQICKKLLDKFLMMLK